MLFKKKDEDVSKSKKKEKKGAVAEWIDAIIFALVVSTIVRVLVFQSYHIPTESMESTQLAGDFLFVNNVSYGALIPFTEWRVPGFTKPEAGDIVVFRWPIDPSIDYIKRCVGGPGDSLQIINKQLYRNGQIFPNPPKSQFVTGVTLPEGVRPGDNAWPQNKPWNRDFYGPIYIPKKGDVIPMNAETYPLYEKCIIYDTKVKPRMVNNLVYLNGKVITEYTIQQDYYFMMGDNRENSLDSRYWGFVPYNNVKGTPLFTWWSWDSNISIFRPIDLLASIRWSRILRPIE